MLIDFLSHYKAWNKYFITLIFTLSMNLEYQAMWLFLKIHKNQVGKELVANVLGTGLSTNDCEGRCLSIFHVAVLIRDRTGTYIRTP